MTSRDLGRLAVVVIVFELVQQGLVVNLRIGAVHADVMVLLPILAGIIGGPSRGALIGFGSGLVADLFLPTPYGLSALVGCLVGFAVGVTTLALDRTSWWLPPLAAFAGSAVYELLYASLGSVIGQPQMLHADLLRIVLVVSITNAVLAVPVMRFVAWGLPAASTEGMPTSTLATGGPR